MESTTDENNCPSFWPTDDELCRRAKQDMGWCTRSNSPEGRCQTMIREDEWVLIKTALRKGEHCDWREERRVKNLANQMLKVHKDPSCTSPYQCLVCRKKYNTVTQLWLKKCPECSRSVCKLCRIALKRSVEDSRAHWHCKICSVNREFFMKSGAWFHRSLPAYLARNDNADDTNDSSTIARSQSLPESLLPTAVCPAHQQPTSDAPHIVQTLHQQPSSLNGDDEQQGADSPCQRHQVENRAFTLPRSRTIDRPLPSWQDVMDLHIRPRSALGRTMSGTRMKVPKMSSRPQSAQSVSRLSWQDT
ncbi:rab effector Noc2-like [Sycon ciliatum]|uniref:rab effector Noc2-like n=1 Tax=Sycon ciliatum TaxID=27933 RepID=UPI0031F6619B